MAGFVSGQWIGAAIIPYAVLWFAIDYDGNLWYYCELYGGGGHANVGIKETAEQVAEKIAAVEGKEKISYGVLDNACWAATDVTGPSIAEAINSTCIHAVHTIPMLTHDKHQLEKYDTQGAIAETLWFMPASLVRTPRKTLQTRHTSRRQVQARCKKEGVISYTKPHD